VTQVEVPEFTIQRAIMEAVHYGGADNCATICSAVVRYMSQPALTNSQIAAQMERLVRKGWLTAEKRRVGQGEFEQEINHYAATEKGAGWLRGIRIPI
jgi:hypothetical protein